MKCMCVMYVCFRACSGPDDSSQNATDGEECADASDGELKSEPASTAAAAANAAKAAAAARAAARRREEAEDLKRKNLEQEAVGEATSLPCDVLPIGTTQHEP